MGCLGILIFPVATPKKSTSSGTCPSGSKYPLINTTFPTGFRSGPTKSSVISDGCKSFEDILGIGHVGGSVLGVIIKILRSNHFTKLRISKMSLRQCLGAI